MRFWLAGILAFALACKGGGQAQPSLSDTADSAPAPVSNTRAPHAGLGYDSLMRAPQEPFKLISTPLRKCSDKPADTLSYEVLRFELKGDSLRGFLQDSIEGNAEAPVPFRELRYDTIARVVTFSAATASRTLMEFQLAANCDSLVGSLIWKTAYDPRYEGSGVHAQQATYRRVRAPNDKP
jgi:hypothetical protein